jgi:hypothetical protein
MRCASAISVSGNVYATGSENRPDSISSPIWAIARPASDPLLNVTPCSFAPPKSAIVTALRATRKLDEPLAVSDRLGVLARAERDLWMLDDRSADAFEAYEAVTETRISHTAVSFHRLAWSLSDIASFLTMFRTTRRQTQWLDQKWTCFLHLLGGAQSTPYC